MSSSVIYTMENLQPTLGSDGKIKEPESNVLLASIENMQYAVGVDVLHTVSIFVSYFCPDYFLFKIRKYF
jgi:hypothetical protein